MRISIPALQLCAKRYGKGSLVGLGVLGDTVTPPSEEALRRIFKELIEAGMLKLGEEGVDFSSVAQVVLSMMTNPDVCVSITNRSNGIRVNIYISDVYYLCAIDNAFDSQNDLDKTLFVDLLPNLKRVVDLFIRAIHVRWSESEGTVRKGEFSVEGRAWDSDHVPVKQWHMGGAYQGDSILCNISEVSNGQTREEGPYVYDDSDAINRVIVWLFACLSESVSVEEEAQWA